MKKLKLISSALCLSLLATGCVSNQKAPASEQTTAAATTAVTTEATTEAPAEATTAAPEEAKASHQVNVDIIKKMTYSDGTNEYNSVEPQIIVDGKAATEINKALSSYIEKNYPMKKDGNNVDGFATSIGWGVKDNILSIVIQASDMGTDFFTYDIFNYDLDTLKAIDDKEVTKVLGMTDDELFSKAKDIVNKFCSERKDSYDLEKSLASINYEKLTPFVLNDGKPCVACSIAYGKDGQFGDSDGVRIFNLTTMEATSLS
ncbi:MAG: hypothetical protein IKW88_05160 [Clostridiales bacterium]|nr:hypothetical protein [Clostridiales bacterium]